MRRALSIVSEEPDDPSMPFNMRQWAREHDRHDRERFDLQTKAINNIWAILAFVGITFVALTGWSLKNQYDSMRTQVEQAQQAQVRFQATWNLQKQIADQVVPKPPQ